MPRFPGSNYGALMAVAVAVAASALPVIVVFLPLQRHFVGSSARSGVKG